MKRDICHRDIGKVFAVYGDDNHLIYYIRVLEIHDDVYESLVFIENKQQWMPSLAWWPTISDSCHYEEPNKLRKLVILGEV